MLRRGVGERREMEKAYYTPQEVASILGIRLQTVYALLESGTIPAIRIKTRWKIIKDVFAEWMKTESWSQAKERTNE